MKVRVLGSTSATSFGIGGITLSLKYGAYLPTLSSYCSDVLLLAAQETGVTGCLREFSALVVWNWPRVRGLWSH